MNTEDLGPMPLRRSHVIRRILRGLRFPRPPRRRLPLAIALPLLAIVGCLAARDRWSQPPPTAAPALPPVVDREIRVRLLGTRPVERFTLDVLSSYRIVDAAGDRPLAAAQAPLRGARVVPAHNPGRGIMLGAVRVESDDFFIEPARDASLVVDGATYRGRLRISRVDGGLALTNVVDVESYLAGVLRGELPRRFHPQAQRAQAVAARTYVLYQKLTEGPNRSFDVLADERSQMYIGVRGEDAVALAAVEDTRGEVCLVRDGGVEKIFCTYYSSCCGGRSQSVTDFRPSDPFVAPLAGGVVCNGCAGAPGYRWGPVSITRAEITRRLVDRYPNLSRLGQVMRVAVAAQNSDGRVTRIRITGSGGASETLVAEDFRLCMGGHTVKSTHFRLIDDGRAVKFVDGRGFGHGVGLCQYGADARARQGRTYRDILADYYPSAIVKPLF